MAEAELARFIDRWTMEFVRHYPHPIERVWRAVTEPAELAQWFIAPTHWELKAGGAYRFDGAFCGVIQIVEPPRLIRFAGPEADGPDGYFQFELKPAAGGTRLRYLHHSTPGFPREAVPADDLPGGVYGPWRPGMLAGWHSGFEELADLLDGAPCGSRRSRTEFAVIAEDWANGSSKVPLTAARKAQIVFELRERERWFELTRAYRAHVKAVLAAAPTELKEDGDGRG